MTASKALNSFRSALMKQLHESARPRTSRGRRSVRRLVLTGFARLAPVSWPRWARGALALCAMTAIVGAEPAQGQSPNALVVESERVATDRDVAAGGKIQVGNLSAASATCLAGDSDRLFGDVDCDGIKGQGEEYLDEIAAPPPLGSPGSVMGALLHLRHQEGPYWPGAGGFLAGTWLTRTLNTVVTNEIPTTLSSNQFTLPAGTYYASGRCPAYKVDKHQVRLRNLTGAVDTLIGPASHASASASVQTDAFVTGRFTIQGTTTFELQHRAQTTSIFNGKGQGAGFGTVEIFCDLRIWEVVP